MALVLHLGVEPVVGAVVGIGGGDLRHAHQRLAGIHLGHGKAVAVVVEGGVDHEFLAVPHKRERAVAGTLIGQGECCPCKVVAVETHLHWRCVARDVQHGGLALEVVVVVEHGGVAGGHTVTVGQIGVVAVQLAAADGDAADGGAAVGAHEINLAVLQHVAARKADVIAPAEADDAGGQRIGHHLAGGGVDDFEFGIAGPGIGEVCVADHKVAGLITGEAAVAAALIDNAGQAIAAHLVDGARALVVDVELAVHAEALAHITRGGEETQVGEFPHLLDAVGDLGRGTGILVRAQVGGLALVAVAVNDAHGIPVTALVGAGQFIDGIVGDAYQVVALDAVKGLACRLLDGGAGGYGID